MLEKIGEYKLVQKLGEGGFGAVYKALSQKGEVVAVKILSSEHTAIDHIVQKFFDEAVILAKIEHKHIANFIRLIKDGETYAIVMEFVDGFTMKDLIEKRLDSYTFDRRMELAKKALEALIYAHERKIVHRDIKPANIMITSEGDVKVTDFGIARISTIATQGTSNWVSLHYAAPERFKTGSVVDERTDIYSMGVTLYELFTGQKPFAQDDMAEILFCHLNTTPAPPVSLVPALPAHVSAALMRALEKDPGRRFKNSADFYNALVLGQFSPREEMPPEQSSQTNRPNRIEQPDQPNNIDKTVAITATGMADKTQSAGALDRTIANESGAVDKTIAADKTIANESATVFNARTVAPDIPAPATKSKTPLYAAIAAAVVLILVAGGIFEDKSASKPASKDEGRDAAGGKKESSGGGDAAGARALKDAGLKAFNEKKYKDAAEKLGRFVKITKDPEAYVYLLWSMSFLGDEAGFKSALDEAMKSPNEKIYEIAVKHYLSAGRKDRAGELLDGGLKVYPDSAKLKGLEPLVKG